MTLLLRYSVLSDLVYVKMLIRTRLPRRFLGIIPGTHKSNVIHSITTQYQLQLVHVCDIRFCGYVESKSDITDSFDMPQVSYGQSVTDRHSKVWRLVNLFIGGCDVIPTQNACNRTLTAACFAIVCARKIAEELRTLKSEQYHSKL